jgi:hypothetical protein
MPGDECKTCNGAGVRGYGNTSTWIGGVGGQMMTTDVCDQCWGSGDRYRKGVNLRQLRAEVGRLPRENRDMSEAEAHGVWRILVECCGCRDDEMDRTTFIICQAKRLETEWRFQGLLGFGGKFWRNMGRWYVSCYPEDKTPEREVMIEKANERLRALLGR